MATKKFNESAEVYAKPHTMSGKGVTVQSEQKSISGAKRMDDLNVGVGTVSKGNTKPEKTDGITMRGAGAATKGIKCRGPMA